MRRLLTLAALLLWLVPAVAQDRGTRLVAIGDIHGAYDEFTTILKRAGLIDERLRWSGGRATLVQTGDYTDRGPDVRQVLDLLMRLEREARSADGTLVTLLGNHEVMNLIGDWRDVTPEICASFAKSPDDGCAAYREAMSPEGVYGRWLRSKPIAATVRGTLFMHAGVNPARPAPRSIKEVNDRAHEEIRRLDQYRRRLVRAGLAQPYATLQEVIDTSIAMLRAASDELAAAKAEGRQPKFTVDVSLLRDAQAIITLPEWSLIDPEGPLWFRGYAQWEESAAAQQVLTLLDSLDITRIVVGHTVTPDRKIASRFGGRVFVIDTGMLGAYKGAPSALEIIGGKLKAIYVDGEMPLH